MLHSTFTLLTYALGLGMLHALDADHLVTISGLSAQKNQWQRAFKYSVHWVIGHSFSLIIIGISVFLLGVSFNQNFSFYAELLVALLLSVIGLRLLINAKQNYHHLKVNIQEDQHSSQKALAIGSIHGVAGTSSILAIIPVAKMDDPYIALSYITIFSAGVLVSMLIFAVLFRHTVIKLIKSSPRSIIFIQVGIGIFAILFALNLTYSSIS